MSKTYHKTLIPLVIALSISGQLFAQKPIQSSKPQLMASPENSGKLVVSFLDCGQGDAAVIQSPNGKVYLVDAGPNEKLFDGDFDCGEDLILPFMKSRNVSKIEAILISHPHLDHYGGALSILGKFKVGEVIDPGWPSSSPHYLKLLKIMDKKKVSYRTVKEGDLIDWGPHLKIDVLGPKPKDDSDETNRKNINDSSIVIKITHGKISFLFPGDIEKGAEKYLVSTFGENLKSQILKAPHHGSKTSSTDEFLNSVEPEIFVISCGRNNRFRHPHPIVLERLEKRTLKVYRTDTDGTIQIISDGESYSVTASGK